MGSKGAKLRAVQRRASVYATHLRPSSARLVGRFGSARSRSSIHDRPGAAAKPLRMGRLGSSVDATAPPLRFEELRNPSHCVSDLSGRGTLNSRTYEVSEQDLALKSLRPPHSDSRDVRIVGHCPRDFLRKPPRDVKVL